MAQRLTSIVESRLAVVIAIVVLSMSFCAAPPRDLSSAHALGVPQYMCSTPIEGATK